MMIVVDQQPPKTPHPNAIYAAPSSLALFLGFLLKSCITTDDVRDVIPKWACPIASAKPRSFVIGYGVLLNEHARAFAGLEESINFPVSVNGYKRSWNKAYPTWTGLGVVATGNTEDTLLALAVSVDTFKEMDVRESGYERVAVSITGITIVEGHHGTLPTDATYYIYVPTKPVKGPTYECPLLLSYIDVIATGAIAISDAFAENYFMKSEGWCHVYNDRGAPKYRGAIAIKDSDKKYVDVQIREVRRLHPWEEAPADCDNSFLNEEAAHNRGEWDQFEANKDLVNGSSTYSESFYTTPIPSTVTAEQIRRAEQLCKEIESQKTLNIQHAVDRGADLEIDEETLHSAVIRD
jgi:hypothetical protein